MPKVVKNIISFFLSLTAISAIILRTVQLLKYTDTNTGYILQSATETMFAFYAICIAMILLCIVFSYKSKCCNIPFENKSNKTLSLFSALAGISLFYDFVHQSLNCYDYITTTSQVQKNYIIPLALVGISALVCSFYFFLMSSYFVSNKYDFRQFKYFHLMPTLWMLFKLLVCLVTYIDERYAEEAFFEYIVLIFGISFFIFVIKCMDNEKFNLNNVVFTGITYGLCALIISVPRIVVLLMNEEIVKVAFSSITYLFTGLFALNFSVNILKFQKITEG